MGLQVDEAAEYEGSEAAGMHDLHVSSRFARFPELLCAEVVLLLWLEIVFSKAKASKFSSRGLRPRTPGP